MNTKSLRFPDAALVAIDFSPCSLRALDTVLSWRSDTTELTLLHVIDSDLGRKLEESGVGTAKEIIGRMHARADEELAALVEQRKVPRMEGMVVEGIPFVEIVKVANDLEMDLIVVGVHGADAKLETLLFGGTAEKVLRASDRPVLCVP
jgi:nucleotide-binding universal stress UspA family protein